MESGRLNSASDALCYIFAGNATFTIRSLVTQNRYTFKVARPKKRQDAFYFVSLLAGPDNENSYQYIGVVRNEELHLTAKSKLLGNSTPVLAFRWMLKSLVAMHLPANVEIWHEGRCGRCGRKLTVPESIEQGIGPECAKFV